MVKLLSFSPLKVSAAHTGTEDQVGPNNSDSEDVDDEEEEEELEGYDSPPMVCHHLP
jgi:general transcription factor 3C polypeptide 5 (transcription factor C subunit 1)